MKTIRKIEQKKIDEFQSKCGKDDVVMDFPIEDVLVLDNKVMVRMSDAREFLKALTNAIAIQDQLIKDGLVDPDDKNRR